MNFWLEPPKPYVMGPSGARQRERLLHVVLDGGPGGVRVETALEDRLGLSRFEILILAGELEAAGQIRMSWRLPEDRSSHLPFDPLERLCLERWGVEPYLFPRGRAAAPTEEEMLAQKAPRYGWSECRPRRRSRKGIEAAVAEVARACGAEVGLYVQTARGLVGRVCEPARRKLARVARRDTCIAVVLDVRGAGRLEAAVELATTIRSHGYARGLTLNARGAALITAVGLHECALHPDAKLGPLTGVGLDAQPGATPEARVEAELGKFGWSGASARALAERFAMAKRPVRGREMDGCSPTPAECTALNGLRSHRPDGDTILSARA